MDRIVDINFRGNAEIGFAVARPEGEIVMVGTRAPEVPVQVPTGILKNLVVRFFMVYHLNPADRAQAVAGVTEALEAGALQHDIATRLPFERLVEAHELMESGTAIGNVVLDLAGGARMIAQPWLRPGRSHGGTGSVADAVRSAGHGAMDCGGHPGQSAV